jgi:hypothetical protein
MKGCWDQTNQHFLPARQDKIAHSFPKQNPKAFSVRCYRTNCGELSRVPSTVPRRAFGIGRTWLADGGTHCRREHVAATTESPLPRASARGVLLPGGTMIVLGGEVENFALLDLWRAERVR